MAWLEAGGLRVDGGRKAAHRLLAVTALISLRLSPVSVEVARSTTAVAATLSTRGARIVGGHWRWELEGTSTALGHTTAADGHTLASSVGADHAVSGSSAETGRLSLLSGWLLLAFTGAVRPGNWRSSASARDGELETGGRTLRLSQLSRLLSLGQGQRVSALVSPTTASASSLTLLLGRLLLLATGVLEATTCSTGRGCRRRASHTEVAHVWHSRLITAMCGLVEAAHSARLLLLLHLWWELELRHSLAHLGVALALLSGQHNAWKLLLLGDHTHVYILLMSSGNLLLLLLQKLDLLLQCQLFHCRAGVSKN